jgi:carbon monoxide dehydrogenase subunit G
VKLAATCAIPRPRAEVWELVMDVERAARCIEGVEEIRATGDDQYEGRLRVRIGTVQLAFEGALRVLERSPESGRGVLLAQAKDVRLGGRFDARLELQLRERAPFQTELEVQVDVTVFGKLGELGQPLIRKKVSTLLERFAERVAQAS